LDTGLEVLSGASNANGVAATTGIFINNTGTQLQWHRVLKSKEGFYCKRVRKGVVGGESIGLLKCLLRK